MAALATSGSAARAAGIAERFTADPARFQTFSYRLDDLLIDVSKCAIGDSDLEGLFDLARTVGLEEKRDAMFAGARINATENRSVLHVALRGHESDGFSVDGRPVGGDVEGVFQAMGAFARSLRDGTRKGATGKAFTDVVNIGIGGSDLGPAMVTLALAPFHDGPRAHFVSNVDGAHIADTLKTLDPETTLFIVASKTFTTIETMTNAATARRFIAEALGEAAVFQHFAAVSTALEKVAAFGIDPDLVFGFWDWVGGRYSVWSAVGLPVMIAIGPERFRAFLDGARDLDRHFKSAPLEENLPVILGLVGWWHRVAQAYPARAILPYDQRLLRLPAYLQQLDMESNGKRVGLDGEPVTTPTGPLVWGEPGTNGQHAFYQLIHQGTDPIPAEFIVAAKGHEASLSIHHELLLANCLAQSEALMVGRSLETARRQLLDKGADAAEAERLAPHRAFPGNRPSITILHETLDPYSLGRLVALYEHRVFVEAQLFGINAFDQWGVELGKELATGLLPVVQGQVATTGRDGSTAGLVGVLREMRKTK
ncbi:MULTISPECIES: glucose-6-phosphate isomerase [unclassified Aureimonas]|uniref:glucose-6-phosphate isomerase n=1 Tax=unclassified Aureimonas TaxID=2615206 RepID=UPI0006FD692A|nr:MULTISPECIES: glucose-6-phosphate isomerase [unclassified Aureimonas]KQT70046.1 glucose-6-phosphate isomerase [Aureimonas sp. Leaf427]KQT76310.1 glucose-6-phosphate isomerase [Aureimonas sp. Leaf460]